MSHIAISFPVVTGPVTQRKNESMRRARGFLKSQGLQEASLTMLRENTYGIVVQDDVDTDFLTAASKHKAKVIPFVESGARKDKSKVKEGSWIKTESGVAGMRFEMRGTTPSNPVEGTLTPGKYFVLGIQESNGGTYATLGRVDSLGQIGRDGPGKYTYNVDLDLLAPAVGSEKNESAKAGKPEPKIESHDRGNEILDMLLENDPYIHAERNRSAKVEAGVEAEPTLDEMMAFDTPADTSTSTEAPALVELTENTEVSTDAETSDSDETEDDDMEEGFDPELFAESRAVCSELEARGYDLETMSENEIDEAIAELYAEAEANGETSEDTADENTADATQAAGEGDGEDGVDSSEDADAEKSEGSTSDDDDSFQIAEGQ